MEDILKVDNPSWEKFGVKILVIDNPIIQSIAD